MQQFDKLNNLKNRRYDARERKQIILFGLFWGSPKCDPYAGEGR
jgi:hypothetical protein